MARIHCVPSPPIARFFTGLFAAFALLHLLLYAFYREAEENLYFGLLEHVPWRCSPIFFFRSHFTTDPRLFQFYDRWRQHLPGCLLALVALRFVYCVYGQLAAPLLRGVLAAALLLA